MSTQPPVAKEIFARIIMNPRYLSRLDWGKPRVGHWEGTTRAHIAELDQNLEALRPQLSEERYWKLKILIHVHDTFKSEANEALAIDHPQSHASQAKQFLAEYCSDTDLLNIIQYHDEGYALWRQFSERGRYDLKRFKRLLALIKDWDLFLWFNIVDGCTPSKERTPLKWFLEQVNKYITTSVTPDLLDK